MLKISTNSVDFFKQMRIIVLDESRKNCEGNKIYKTGRENCRQVQDSVVFIYV